MGKVCRLRSGSCQSDPSGRRAACGCRPTSVGNALVNGRYPHPSATFPLTGFLGRMGFSFHLPVACCTSLVNFTVTRLTNPRWTAVCGLKPIFTSLECLTQLRHDIPALSSDAVQAGGADAGDEGRLGQCCSGYTRRPFFLRREPCAIWATASWPFCCQSISSH
jgi:hypothetical protein